jgi:hypothetical protein
MFRQSGSIFRSGRTITVLTLLPIMAIWLMLTTLNDEGTPGAGAAPMAVTPTVTATCPPIEHEVVASIDPLRVHVGDTFTLTSESTGYAGLAEVRLYVEYPLAAVPDLEIHDQPSLPLVEVLPTSHGSSLGSGEFVLRALREGTLQLHTEVYGDAFFTSPEQCYTATHFLLVRSNPVSVRIWPEE